MNSRAVDDDIVIVGPSMQADASNEDATVDGREALMPSTSSHDHENNEQLRVGISDDERNNGGINSGSREHASGSHDYDPNGSQSLLNDSSTGSLHTNTTLLTKFGKIDSITSNATLPPRGANNNNNTTTTPTAAARNGRSYSNPTTARKSSAQQQQQHGILKKSNSITSSMVINSMTMNSSSSGGNGSSNMNIDTNANSSGSSDVFNNNSNNMMLMSLSIDNGDEAKNSIATFDANAFNAPDGSTFNEGMYDDGSKDMYLKFLLNKDQNRGSKTSKFVSGSQFRNISSSKTTQCESCIITDNLAKKHKEVVRGLKVVISRLEEQLHDLKKARTAELIHFLTVKNTAEFDEHIKEQLLLKKRCEYFEDELNKMKKMVNLEKSANEGLKKTLEEQKGRLKAELNVAQVKIIELTTELDIERNKRAGFQKSNEDLATTLTLYKKQLEKAENKLSDCMIQLNAQKHNLTGSIDNLKEIARLKELTATQEIDNKLLQQSIEVKTTECTHLKTKLSVLDISLKALEDRIALLQESNNHLAGDLRALQDVYGVAKKRVDLLEDSLHSSTRDKELLNRRLISTEVTLEQSQQKNKDCEKEISSLNAKLSDLLLRMTKESENTKKALEKAITSSVRLCVVAPTVNVHVADRKLKFKAGLSQTMLKEFLSHEVLDRYSFLFKQKTENSSPDGDSLESWLQSLLAQMQASIEQHVQSAMDNSSM